MNYELAEQLKDAGFPQHEGSIDPHCHDSHCQGGGCFKEYCVPNLSELIEACGKSGFFLMWEDNKWVAGKMHSGITNRGFGGMPETATAKLFIALKNGTLHKLSS